MKNTYKVLPKGYYWNVKPIGFGYTEISIMYRRRLFPDKHVASTVFYTPVRAPESDVRMIMDLLWDHFMAVKGIPYCSD